MPRITVTPLTDSQVPLALEVWASARRAADRPPGAERTERVRRRLRESVSDEAGVTLLAHYGDRPTGMLAAEPYRDEGAVTPGAGHISMVFVSPEYWGCRVGSALVRALQTPPPDGWDELSVWTRTQNRRGRRLYASTGFLDTGERSQLPGRRGDHAPGLVSRLSTAAACSA
ncbi:MAG: GNAT family N-acetyltransferase [Nocardioides sp.]|uniref:GNAT family N-acetyltransferase n=1 Tax=Nocardioides sp. TaxID=35761 RepID=UPI003F02E422